MLADREARNLVVAVRNDLRALRVRAHIQPMQILRRVQVKRRSGRRRIHVADALLNQLLRLRMQLQRHPERGCRALTRVVVGRGAYAARRENDVAGLERAPQRCGNALRIVADVLRPAERQPARAKQFDDFRQMLVDAPARQDFIADDDDAKCHCRLFGCLVR